MITPQTQAVFLHMLITNELKNISYKGTCNHDKDMTYMIYPIAQAMLLHQLRTKHLHDKGNHHYGDSNSSI